FTNEWVQRIRGKVRREMIDSNLIGRLRAAGAAMGALYLASCGAAPGNEQDPGTDPESVTGSCSLSITKNTYDRPNYWGTMTDHNDGPSGGAGYAVAFDVASGAHCTNDAVPAGATLSPLSGSGSSAYTTSNHCVFTFTGSLASGASKTFNYSADDTDFSAAAN